jgi:putative sigma-54 modulation protein
MNIKIRGVNCEITGPVNDYVNKKISSLEKFLEKKMETICEVEIGKTTNHHKSGDIFRAEINLMEPGKAQVFAVAEAGDLYSAIDIVRDEAEREIVTHKKKKDTLFRRGALQVKNLLKRVNFKRNG